MESDLTQTGFSLLIASNWAQRRQLLQSVLSPLADRCIIASADYVEARQILNERMLDILVIDRWFPGDNIMDLVTTVKYKFPTTCILLLDSFKEISNSYRISAPDREAVYDLPLSQVLSEARQLLGLPGEDHPKGASI